MRTLLACTTLAVTTALAAQGTVVPSLSATVDPGFYDYYSTFGSTSTTTKNEGRAQYLYDSKDVGGSAVFQSISWRRPRYPTTAYAATTFSMTIIMSNSPVAYNAPSTTFSANHGSSTSGTPPQTVLNGQISLPATSLGSSWPEPWFAPIPITSFVHTPVNGGSLVIECIGSNNSQGKSYYCEGHRPDAGLHTTNGPSGGCQYHSDGGWNNGIQYSSTPTIGGTWSAQYNSMPSNEPNMLKSLEIVGLQGIGGTAFGMTLPIPIANLGFQDICTQRAGVLGNDLVLLLPLTYTPSTAGPSKGSLKTPTVKIPNDPKLGGQIFFTQPICPDKPLNGFDQIYMGWPSQWIIGAHNDPKGNTVYQTGNNASTTGKIRSGYGRTMLLK